MKRSVEFCFIRITSVDTKKTSGTQAALSLKEKQASSMYPWKEATVPLLNLP